MKKIFAVLILLFPLYALAGAHALYDFETHSYIIKNNGQEVRPIASITKVITAVTVLNSGVNLQETIKVNGQADTPNYGVYGNLDNIVDLVQNKE